MSENEFSVNEFIVREMGYPGVMKQEVVGELVRCADCKHRSSNNDWFETLVCPCECGEYSWNPPDDFFCAYGERSEE